VREPGTGVEWALIAVAVVIAVAGMVAAWRLLPFERLLPARQAPAEQGLGRLLWKRYYVDDLYDRIIVRPIVWVSRQVLGGS
jgi:NADH-quinone oxidoreductase subunit L